MALLTEKEAATAQLAKHIDTILTNTKAALHKQSGAGRLVNAGDAGASSSSSPVPAAAEAAQSSSMVERRSRARIVRERAERLGAACRTRRGKEAFTSSKELARLKGVLSEMNYQIGCGASPHGQGALTSAAQAAPNAALLAG